MNLDFAPILIFVYNRPKHIEQTISALKNNKLAPSTDLIIYSDGAKDNSQIENVITVRKYLQTIDGFNSIRIIERATNYGLGNNIIDGVSAVVKEYGKVIVLEDDLLTSPYFLEYMNAALQTYKDTSNVISIHSYIYPTGDELPETFFIKGADCLGWGTWKEKWSYFEKDGSKLLAILEERKLTKEFDFNNSYPYTQMLKDQIAGKNTSWAVRWYASAFINNMLTLYPGRSLIFHNGNDGSGTNCGTDSILDVQLTEKPISINFITPVENTKAKKSIEKYFKKSKPNLIISLAIRLKRLVKKWK